MSCNHKKHHHECGCHEHHHDEECCCHQEHHHEHEEECCCHHHHHEGCCCHEHDEGCCCGCGHNHKSNFFIFILIRAAISIVLMIASTLVDDLAKNVILIVAYLIISYDVLISAFKNIIKGRAFDENFLMSIASLTALIVPIFTSNAHID